MCFAFSSNFQARGSCWPLFVSPLCVTSPLWARPRSQKMKCSPARVFVFNIPRAQSRLLIFCGNSLPRQMDLYQWQGEWLNPAQQGRIWAEFNKAHSKTWLIAQPTQGELSLCCLFSQKGEVLGEKKKEIWAVFPVNSSFVVEIWSSGGKTLWKIRVLK